MQTGMTKGVNENESDECTRNNIFCDLLTSLGVGEKTAMDDACRMEHAVSKKSFLSLILIHLRAAVSMKRDKIIHLFLIGQLCPLKR